MLYIMLSEDDDHEAFELVLEHSLVSISRWESIHEKAFYNKDGMTPAETLSYIRQMVVGSAPPPGWVNRLQAQDFATITEYINSKQSATWFRESQEQKPSRGGETVTSELIYYWMIGFNIPFQPAETWHVNRLMTLIKICGIKQTKPKKMSKQAQAEEYRRLNALRREQLGTTG